MEMITRQDWNKVFQEISSLMIEQKNLLTEIDAKFGDGDHGNTVCKIGHLLSDVAKEWSSSDESLKELFKKIGDGVLNVNGGSAGPLYGTYLGGFGENLNDEVDTDATLLKKILLSGLTELQFISNAKVGDKTMMDTLIPATEAAQKANDDILSIVKDAKEAAQAGAENTKNYVSKFGRARLYKEQTIGTEDAGAMSCTYIFIGMYNALAK